MKYKTSDIIKRAMTVADLNNSKFIGYAENISLLNENYTSMYQKLSNKNDKTFLKTVYTTLSSFSLPDDFFALQGIYLEQNNNIMPILRRADTESPSGLKYEIIGNTIQLYGYSYGKIRIQYYPKPVTLTYPAESKKITTLPTEYNSTTVYPFYLFGEIALMTDLNDNYGVYDLSSQSWLCGVTVQISNIIAITGRYVVTISGIHLINSNLATSYGNTYTPIIKGEKLYLFDSTNQVVYEFINGVSYETEYSFPADASSAAVMYTADFDNFYTAIYNNDTSYYDWYYNQVKIDTKEITHLIAFMRGELFYLISYDSNITQIERGEITGTRNMAENKNFGTMLGLCNVDSDDGLGILHLDISGTNIYMSGYAADIELEVPSNFYFVLMSYYMALSYKTRQNSDTTQLLALIDQQESTFFDTLSNDDYGPSRINHIY